MVRLGAFRLESFIAAGGQGAVYRAQHTRSGLPTAVKTVSSPHGRADPTVRLELEALASLVHPNIVAIYDFGEVPERFVLDGQATPAGAIWIAMELGTGSLKHRPPENWEELRSATDQLLSALAYSHARGVLHRDVKPANTLWSDQGRLKLSDFGLAVIDGEAASRAAGTYTYMAPEQQVGDLPRLGPWTDLFAVGVTVWRWVCPSPPFPGNNNLQVLMRKVREDVDTFRPRFAVPHDLSDWLQTCMRAAPSDRFELVADARHAFESLRAPRGRASRRPEPVEDDTATVISGRSVAGTALPASRHPRPAPAPMTTDWETESTRAIGLLDAGLELFGLRALPTVGRRTELGELWRALVEVRRTGQPSMAVLTGPPGMGRSHLVQAVRERAHLRGAARSIEVAPGSERCRSTLWSRFGTDSEMLEEQLVVLAEETGELPEGLAEQVAAACLEPGADGVPALIGLLRSMARRRPVVLVVEDAHVGVDALLDAVVAARDLPCLVLATVPEDAVGALPDRGQRLLRLEPLPPDDHVEVCRSLLGLEPALAARLAEVSDGNPGLAVQICDHWVQGGNLRPTSAGYTLAEGAEASLPALSQWMQRLEDLRLSGPARIALRIAAHMGREVDLGRLGSVVEDPRVLEPLVEALVLRRLAIRTAQGMRWTHRAFLEAVLASEVPHPLELASLAADALVDQPAFAVPRALALVDAERWDEAAPLLVECIEQLDAAGRHPQVLPLVRAWERLIRARPEVGVEAVEIAHIRALRSVGGIGDATGEVIEGMVERASRRGWRQLLLWIELVQLDLRGPDLPERLANLVAALDVLPESELHIEVLHRAAMAALAEGRPQDAVAFHRRAVAIAARLQLAKAPFFRVALAQSLGRAGLTDEAMATLSAARTDARDAGRPFAEFYSWIVEGEVHTRGDDHRAALACFERACAIARRIGEHQEWYVRACAGLSERLLGDIEAARETFYQCLNAPSRSGYLFAHLGLLAIETDDAAFERHWAYLAERWLEPGHAERIVAEVLAVAGDHQLEHGRRGRARRLYEASAAQLERLGEPSEAVRAMVRRL